MKKQHSVFYNFIMNAILTASSFIFPLITFPYVSRVLMPEGTGKVSFAGSVVNYFVLIAQLGIPMYGIRECAQARDDREKLSKVFQEIFVLSILMCVLAYLLFFAALAYVPRIQQEKTLMIITSASILFTTLGVEWLYKALEMYSYITWRSIAFKCLSVIAMFLMVHRQEDYVIYGAISIFAASASNILNFSYLHKLVDMRLHYHLDLRRHIKPILVFFAMSCAITVYTNLDITMLGFMKTDADVGYYNVAVRLKTMLVSMITSLGAVLLPRVSVYIEQGDEKGFCNIIIKAFQFVLFASIPMMLYCMIAAKPLILLLSGSRYDEAIKPLQIMMPTLLFIGLSNIMSVQVLIAMGKENKSLYSVILGAVIDLILNILLIPKYSVSGAAIGTTVAELAVTTYVYFAERDLFHRLFRSVHPWRIIVAAVAATVTTAFVLMIDWNLLVTLAASGVSFAGIYLMVLLLLKEPFVSDMVRVILKKKI